MGKKKIAIDAKRGTIFLADPNSIELVTDRSHPLYDERVLNPVSEDMVKSIRLRGILQPIRVRKQGDKMVCVVGRQRLKAARVLREEDSNFRIPVLLTRGEDADLAEEMVIENELRTGDAPSVKAKKADRLLRMGRDEAEVAVCFGVQPQTLRIWLKLLDLAPKVQQAVDAGKVGLVETVRRLGDLDPADQLKALSEIESTGVSAEKAAAKRGGRPTKKHSGVGKVRLRRVFSLMGDHSPEKELLGWVLGELTDSEFLGRFPTMEDALKKPQKEKKEKKEKKKS